MTKVHRRIVGCLVLVAALCTAAPASAKTPIPSVSGPIPVTADSYPFLAADHNTVPQDLRKYGYVEEEYFVSGKANVYDWSPSNEAVVRTPNAPYTTRVLVRRPAKRSDFSGNVVVEMLNPSALLDLSVIWALSNSQYLRNGDVWVGVTSKPVAVKALKAFDPERYDALSWANPRSLDDPLNCTTVAADSSRTTENGLIYDIFSQVGAWLKSDARSNPLTDRSKHRHGQRSSGLRLFGTGHSQTGNFLYPYINGVQPLVVKADGKPIYDGYLVAVASGSSPLNQCSPTPPVGDPRRQFDNAGVPIIRVMSQADYLPALWARRADSNARPDRYRHYEMAGAGHATLIEWNFGPSPEDILKSGNALRPDYCDQGPVSRFPVGIYFDAMFQNLVQWVRKGSPPPSTDPILVANGVPVLDEFGNVQGGLRSPFVDVPTSAWPTNATGAPFCPLAGWEVPFDQARLDTLYPSHRAYVKAVARNVKQLVRDRILTRYDGTQLIDEAAHADIP